MEIARAGAVAPDTFDLDCCYSCLHFYKYPTESESCNKCAEGGIRPGIAPRVVRLRGVITWLYIPFIQTLLHV